MASSQRDTRHGSAATDSYLLPLRSFDLSQNKSSQTTDHHRSASGRLLASDDFRGGARFPAWGLSREGSIASFIDRKVLGSHIWSQGKIYDPEGSSARFQRSLPPSWESSAASSCARKMIAKFRCCLSLVLVALLLVGLNLFFPITSRSGRVRASCSLADWQCSFSLSVTGLLT